MMKTVSSLVCLVLTLGLLLCLALAVPSASIEEEAQIRYMEENTDDEYDFL
ncbi:MAG: hypothetical protein IJ246_07095 [Clostridia bacterium]|nr:hypothetical protein [Clostridia bacterium]